MRYVIVVKGPLDAFWQAWFDHLSITHEGDSTTLLSGPIRDRAALYGLLFTVRGSLPRSLRGHPCSLQRSKQRRPGAALVRTTRDAFWAMSRSKKG